MNIEFIFIIRFMRELIENHEDNWSGTKSNNYGGENNKDIPY